MASFTSRRFPADNDDMEPPLPPSKKPKTVSFDDEMEDDNGNSWCFLQPQEEDSMLDLPATLHDMKLAASDKNLSTNEDTKENRRQPTDIVPQVKSWRPPEKQPGISSPRRETEDRDTELSPLPRLMPAFKPSDSQGKSVPSPQTRPASQPAAPSLAHGTTPNEIALRQHLGPIILLELFLVFSNLFCLIPRAFRHPFQNIKVGQLHRAIKNKQLPKRLLENIFLLPLRYFDNLHREISCPRFKHGLLKYDNLQPVIIYRCNGNDEHSIDGLRRFANYLTEILQDLTTNSDPYIAGSYVLPSSTGSSFLSDFLTLARCLDFMLEENPGRRLGDLLRDHDLLDRYFAPEITSEMIYRFVHNTPGLDLNVTRDPHIH